ncbi:hypothetical protein POTOM_043008 [Populus tomentosa]|uniref:Uncharacterized protein n=1 Tax=Populus tomentosa TaxID=118781 RepID=A0A8X7YLC4_POPTO|nr:hypothetical protein POTOM_043008 [Populus tomentosa]
MCTKLLVEAWKDMHVGAKRKINMILLVIIDVVKEARSKVSEKLAKMHDGVLNAHEESKDLEKVLKDLT